MSEYTIETRRRSRSKTPFLRSSCDHENCEHAGGDEPHHTHHHKKKVTSQAPNVKTITEETVEVTSSSSSVGAGKNSPSKVAQTKIKTSDYSSEESPENRNKISTRSLTTSSVQANTQQQKQQHSLTETRTSTTITTKRTKVGGSSVATSTPKLNNYIKTFAAQFDSRGDGQDTIDLTNNEVQYQGHRHNEHTQNLINAEKEINSSKNSSKSLSGFLGRSFGGDRSINFNANDHMAYIEYKQVGEYWKKTPKTDYTYSELSPHRREIAPGIIAMPNMSRLSLENHHERINYMIQRNPAQESHIRQRYESPRSSYQNRKEAERLAYDSGDELDYTHYQSSYGKQNESWIMRVLTTIVATITTTWSSLTGHGSGHKGAGMYAYNSSMYRTKLANERGFFGSIMHGISSAYMTIVGYIYLFISSVLCLDTWLLQSSHADSRGRKRFLLFLLMLLPLLLLAGSYYYLYPNEPFPPKRFSQYTLTLPEIRKIDMSNYINEEKFNEYKSQAINHIDDLRDWSNDYFLYLKTVAQNLVDEGRKVFQSEEHYERV